MVLGKDLYSMSSDVQDPRFSLVASLDIHKCRVEFSGAPIVLLCGGKVSRKQKPDDPDLSFGSLRHAITDTASSFEVFLPEAITSWQSDGIFKDLMSFERELASICSLVVIVLESEGALVELGAFSQLSELSDKIIAICASEHRARPSFINLGILRFISEKKSSSVRSYPWETKYPHTITKEVVDDATSDIQSELDCLPKSQVFRPDQNSHVMVVICELLRLFVALKESEILEFVLLFGIAVTKEELRGKLFLLKEFHLIKEKDYSDSVFYMRSNEQYHKLRFAHKEKSEPIDALRVNLQCMEFYKDNPKHRNRHRAIASSVQGIRA